mmetsp:Transcript_71813/g.199302  ORF Transcript_71813/g.199302 Transcript_71813/m.199302 type:complete len:124 (-) Transcript_71813:3-374(-)
MWLSVSNVPTGTMTPIPWLTPSGHPRFRSDRHTKSGKILAHPCLKIVSKRRQRRKRTKMSVKAQTVVETMMIARAVQALLLRDGGVAVFHAFDTRSRPALQVRAGRFIIRTSCVERKHMVTDK